MSCTGRKSMRRWMPRSEREQRSSRLHKTRSTAVTPDISVISTGTFGKLSGILKCYLRMASINFRNAAGFRGRKQVTTNEQIGRETCRERVSQNVYIGVVAVTL